MSTFSNSINQQAILKELYTDNADYLENEVYKENPFLALVPKNESADGFGGKYLPVPIQVGVTQGTGHSFASAQAQQSAPVVDSFFVAVISSYAIVTITNLLMEQTKTNAAAFVDAAKLNMDSGFRSLANQIAFELFADGTGTRGFIGSATNPSGNIYVITLSNADQIVQFEVNMTLINYAVTLSGQTITNISSLSSTTGLVTAVDRTNGIVTILASGSDSSWLAAGNGLGVNGDVVAGAPATSSALCLSGVSAWIPYTAPASGGATFWNVDRSTDPTRLAGIRFNGSALTIEEAINGALGLMNREGAKPDMCFINFSSFVALINALSAKVQYVTMKHDEVEVAFEGITFQSAYGRVTILADRSVPPKTAFLLTMSTWKLRSTGKVPHVLTYGVEGLEGLRLSTSDALEVRLGYYGNLVCSAPGYNAVVTLSS